MSPCAIQTALGGPKIRAEWNKTLSNEPGNEVQGDKDDGGKEAAACSYYQRHSEGTIH